MLFQTHFHSEPLSYFGPELAPHFILSRFKVEGSCLSAFIGPCMVKTDHLVDWEDRLANDHIKAASMIHFLGEFFGITLKEGVWIQRLLVSEILAFLLVNEVEAHRLGDDLYIGTKGSEKKLSVSIVTASPVSVLLHLGINIDSEGAPVEAIGLKDLKLDPKVLIEFILTRFKDEYESVARACVKVRPVI
jgi:hypothetical protein